MEICTTSLKENLQIFLSVRDPTHEDFFFLKKAGTEQVSSYCIGCSDHYNDAPPQAHHRPIAELESRPAKPTSREITRDFLWLHSVSRHNSRSHEVGVVCGPPHTKLLLKNLQVKYLRLFANTDFGTYYLFQTNSLLTHHRPQYDNLINSSDAAA